jgi:hypothetical protein
LPASASAVVPSAFGEDLLDDEGISGLLPMLTS